MICPNCLCFRINCADHFCGGCGHRLKQNQSARLEGDPIENPSHLGWPQPENLLPHDEKVWHGQTLVLDQLESGVDYHNRCIKQLDDGTVILSTGLAGIYLDPKTPRVIRFQAATGQSYHQPIDAFRPELEGFAGIDFGTAGSCVAVSKGGMDDPVYCVSDKSGNMITPSVIVILDDNASVIGNEALASISPDKAVWSVKRAILDGGITVDGRQYSPELLVRRILHQLLLNAAIELNALPCRVALCTPPTYLGEPRRILRQALRDATAEICGDDNLADQVRIELVDEPVASAALYVVNEADLLTEDAPRHLLVIDFGAGTLDIALLLLHERRLRPIALGGLRTFGGDDVDLLIRQQLIERCIKQGAGDPVFLRTTQEEQYHYSQDAWLQASRKTKIALSEQRQTRVLIESKHLGASQNTSDWDGKVKRQHFDKWVEQKWDDVAAQIMGVLDSAGVSAGDVSDLLLTGRSAQIPSFRARVEKLFPRRIKAVPENKLPIKTSVAMGASWLVAINHMGGHFTALTQSICPADYGLWRPTGSVGVFERLIGAGSACMNSNGFEGWASDDFAVHAGTSIQCCWVTAGTSSKYAKDHVMFDPIQIKRDADARLYVAKDGTRVWIRFTSRDATEDAELKSL